MQSFLLTKQIPLSMDRAKMLFWNIQLWQSVWDPIHKVDVVYDDGLHQEFVMDLTWNSGLEQIRTIRFKENDKILFFSPKPPFPMDYHVGSWTFSEISGGEEQGSCLVKAERMYSVVKMEEDLRLFHKRFTDRLTNLLDQFSKRVSDEKLLL